MHAEREIEEKLSGAAINGSVTTLLGLLDQDPLILDKIIVSCTSQNPLHISSMLGHSEFVGALLAQTPQLASETDPDGNSALHLAAARGHVEVVGMLLSADPEVGTRRNGDGRTPLHLAASKGRAEAARRIVRAAPESARAATDQGETVLHVCAGRNRLEALRAVVEEAGREVVEELVNRRDGDGNTVLHIAVAKKQVEMIQFLLTIPGLEVNTPNSSGLTALDILEQSPRGLRDLEIETALQNSGASLSKDIQSIPYHYDPILDTARKTSHTTTTSRSPKKSPSLSTKRAPSKKLSTRRKSPPEPEWLSQKRSSLMVVASLLATVAFQAAITPPGGVWQDDYKVDADGNPVKEPHLAGTSIMAHVQRIAYGQFMIFNTLAFLSSLSIILLLLSGLPIRRRRWMWIQMVIMWLAITGQAITYFIALRNMSPADTRGMLKDVTDVSVVCWMCLMVMVFMGNVVRLNVWVLRKWGYLKKKEKDSAEDDEDKYEEV
ncbi:ankyrin repeat-containing protein ITN1-like [Rhodamnia argentea]|uniref:Ankyrin repeat-containing protein ITN1-like n=1 Tax=Rhodamnia argentea TaxID=178133 RepID=A0A8B8QXG3_9MYRT|nr:ankyrin repeat-containing protein ITN1-like [Rhodamnia argentea]